MQWGGLWASSLISELDLPPRLLGQRDGARALGRLSSPDASPGSESPARFPRPRAPSDSAWSPSAHSGSFNSLPFRVLESECAPCRQEPSAGNLAHSTPGAVGLGHPGWSPLRLPTPAESRPFTLTCHCHLIDFSPSLSPTATCLRKVFRQLFIHTSELFQTQVKNNSLSTLKTVPLLSQIMVPLP